MQIKLNGWQRIGIVLSVIIFVGLVLFVWGSKGHLTAGTPTPPVTADTPPPPVTAGTPNDPTGKFVALVLGDTEDQWTEIFAAAGKTYHPPKLRLFSGSEPTPCAFAHSAMGPFYCPRDQRMYLDTSFFHDLQNLSEAIVIAHLVGHHVQDELGTLPRVQAQQATASEAEANRLQVRVELQADCFAGVWANRAQRQRNFFDPGDFDRLLQMAFAIGEPDAITHGTPEQRKRWFMSGFEDGQSRPAIQCRQARYKAAPLGGTRC